MREGKRVDEDLSYSLSVLSLVLVMFLFPCLFSRLQHTVDFFVAIVVTFLCFALCFHFYPAVATVRAPHRPCGVPTRAKEDLARIFKRARNQLSIGTPHDPVEGCDRLYQGCQNRFFDVGFRSLSEAFSECFFFGMQRKKRIPIEVSPGQRVDEPLSYDRLQAFLKTVNMPDVHPLPVLPNGEPSSVKGGRRSLEDLLLMMAERALSVPHLKEGLTWLNSTEGHFQYALGGDGAPVDKVKDLTMVMVSLLNSGKRVGSPSENFVLAAGDAGELNPVWKEVVKEAVAEGERIAQKTYTICGMECRFTVHTPPGAGGPEVAGTLRWRAAKQRHILLFIRRRITRRHAGHQQDLCS